MAKKHMKKCSVLVITPRAGGKKVRLGGYKDLDTWRRGLWGSDPDLKRHKACAWAYRGHRQLELAVAAGVQGHYCWEWGVSLFFLLQMGRLTLVPALGRA